MIASAPWTRRHIFRDIPEDILVHVDIPNANGWHRYWFAMIPFGDRVVEFPVMTQSYLTTPTGSNQTTTAGVDGTWNNSNNRIESLGAGGSGGCAPGVSNPRGTGGGGGAYAKAVNFNITNPGVTTFTWQLGIGGTAKTTASVGVAGGNTWFNDTVFATGSDNTQCNAAGGGAGQEAATASTVVGGTAGTTGWGTTITAGGAGGAVTTTGTHAYATGGGGTGGPNGIGGTGGAASTSTAIQGTAGGQGDSTSGGAGGSAGTSANGGNGVAGTELGDGVHGCGGGGGGAASNQSTALTAGNAGLYGAGGGGASNAGTGGATSGTGSQGLIVLTWTPGATTKHQNLLPLLGAGMIVSSQFDRRQLMKMIVLLRGIRL